MKRSKKKGTAPPPPRGKGARGKTSAGKGGSNRQPNGRSGPRPKGRSTLSRDLGGRTGVVLVHPGLEHLLEEELSELGLDGVKVEEGGVAAKMSFDALETIHGRSWVGGRVLVRLAKVRAESLDALAGGVRSIPWQDFLRPRQNMTIKVSTHRAHLRRKDAVAKKVQHAVRDVLRGNPSVGGMHRVPAQEIYVRIVEDRAWISIDASGELLHRRGWRQVTAKAPLRENLAAAILKATGWVPGIPVVDPMCGSGTFVIEAARMSAGLSPRTSHQPMYQHWPIFGRRKLAAPQVGVATGGLFLGADRNAGAITASKSNAKRAGVSRAVSFQETSFGDLTPPSTPGLLVANLPYGRRVSSGYEVERMYRGFGSIIERWEGWRVAMLVPDPRSLRWLHPSLEPVLHFSNGGIPVTLGVGEISAAQPW